MNRLHFIGDDLELNAEGDPRWLAEVFVHHMRLFADLLERWMDFYRLHGA